MYQLADSCRQALSKPIMKGLQASSQWKLPGAGKGITFLRYQTEQTMMYHVQTCVYRVQPMYKQVYTIYKSKLIHLGIYQVYIKTNSFAMQFYVHAALERVQAMYELGTYIKCTN